MGYCLGYSCNNILSLFLLCGKEWKQKTSDEKIASRGSWRVAINRHLFLLSGPDPLHISLSNMADNYGPVFSVRLGTRRGLIVNSWETAKECYRTNDVAFSNRPKTAAIGLMGYNFAMLGFSNYGPKVTALGDVREFQIRALMKSMSENYYSCVSKRDEEGEGEMAAVYKGILQDDDCFHHIRCSPASQVDGLFWRMHKAFKKTGRNFDTMLQAWLEEHKKQKKTTSEDDFMGEMLSVADSVAQEFPFYDADTINKATCQISKRIRHRKISLHPSHNQGNNAPTATGTREPREAGEDCVVAGYHVPAGTRLFVNAWKIQRDPRVWANPLEFRPERFLTSHKEVDVQGLHFELLPFGGGRRVCPAISFALQATQLALASFLHGFDVETPSGEAVDMTGSFGTTNMKATPLEVCLRPRLSPELYA
ncbi:hypothetical protein Pfo_029167 [Paulownia fortunei]|nr:hypothetical protein Pfo_029167 [Paulownia fortunei]